MRAAKEKTLSFKVDPIVNRMDNQLARQRATTTTPTVINRISSYDFRARKFKKSPIGPAEKNHQIVPVGAPTKPRKSIGEITIQWRESQWPPGMSLYRAYFVPGGVDPMGMDIVVTPLGGEDGLVCPPAIDCFDFNCECEVSTYHSKRCKSRTQGTEVKLITKSCTCKLGGMFGDWLLDFQILPGSFTSDYTDVSCLWYDGVKTPNNSGGNYHGLNVIEDSFVESIETRRICCIDGNCAFSD